MGAYAGRLFYRVRLAPVLCPKIPAGYGTAAGDCACGSCEARFLGAEAGITLGRVAPRPVLAPSAWCFPTPGDAARCAREAPCRPGWVVEEAPAHGEDSRPTVTVYDPAADPVGGYR